MKKMFSEEGCGLLGPVLDRSSNVLSEICPLAIWWTLVTLTVVFICNVNYYDGSKSRYELQTADIDNSVSNFDAKGGTEKWDNSWRRVRESRAGRALFCL